MIFLDATLNTFTYGDLQVQCFLLEVPMHPGRKVNQYHVACLALS